RSERGPAGAHAGATAAQDGPAGVGNAKLTLVPMSVHLSTGHWKKHLCRIASAMCAFPLAFVLAGAQVPVHQRSAAAKIPSQFAEAQQLIGQGRLDEARQEIQAQLKQNPTSVEGFN